MREWSEEISANFHGCLENSKLGCKEMNPDFVDCWESCFPAQKLEKGSKLFQLCLCGEIKKHLLLYIYFDKMI